MLHDGKLQNLTQTRGLSLINYSFTILRSTGFTIYSKNKCLWVIEYLNLTNNLDTIGLFSFSLVNRTYANAMILKPIWLTPTTLATNTFPDSLESQHNELFCPSSRIN